jgi:hypothetical protein
MFGASSDASSIELESVCQFVAFAKVCHCRNNEEARFRTRALFAASASSLRFQQA